MQKYNSLLKEEKKYQEPLPLITKPKKFPWFTVDLICITILLLISYLIYYQQILTPDKIFLNDLKKVSDKYSKIISPLKIEKLLVDNINLIGTISINDSNYNYAMDKALDKIDLQLSKDDINLQYQILPTNQYINISTYKKEYLKLSKAKYNLQLITNLKNYLNTIPSDKFSRKIYLKDNTPIVESNFTLKNEDIKDVLGLKEDINNYEVLFTFKNHAIKNNIISMKIIINNYTTSKRKVITYEEDTLKITSDDQVLELKLNQEQQNFNLKIKKDDNLYSVLTGTVNGDNYQYTYQVIDKIYNLNLIVSQEDNIYTYKLTTNIENELEDIVTKNLILTLDYQKQTMTEIKEINDSINYKDLTNEEKEEYDYQLNNLIGELKTFFEHLGLINNTYIN